jgi:hypothetical protein
MFANTQMMGMNLAFPDVCLTPTPAPVPIPYPNVAMRPMGLPPVPNVLISVAPAHNMATTIPLTNGDNVGVNMGVASGLVMGPNHDVTAAFTVLVGGLPQTRMTSVTVQNNTNAPGCNLVPSQVRCLTLSA